MSCEIKTILKNYSTTTSESMSIETDKNLEKIEESLLLTNTQVHLTTPVKELTKERSCIKSCCIL